MNLYCNGYLRWIAKCLKHPSAMGISDGSQHLQWVFQMDPNICNGYLRWIPTSAMGISDGSQSALNIRP